MDGCSLGDASFRRAQRAVGVHHHRHGHQVPCRPGSGRSESTITVFVTLVFVTSLNSLPMLRSISLQMLILASQGLLSSIYWLNRYVASLEMAMNSGQSVASRIVCSTA